MGLRLRAPIVDFIRVVLARQVAAMSAFIIKQFAVHIPLAQDTSPQHMRIRLRPQRTEDEVLFQIEFQLSQHVRDELGVPLLSSDYDVYLVNDMDDALVLLKDASEAVVQSSSKLILHRRTPLTRTANVPATDLAEALALPDAPCGAACAPDAEGDAASHTSSAMPVQYYLSHFESDDTIATSELGEIDPRSGKSTRPLGHVYDDLLFDGSTESAASRTMKTMLRIVERLFTEYVLHSSRDQRGPMDEEEWSKLMNFAIMRDNTSPSRLDKSVVRLFKRAIVDSLNRAQRFRVVENQGKATDHESSAVTERLTKENSQPS